MTELADVALGTGLVTAVAPFAQAYRIAQRAIVRRRGGAARGDDLTVIPKR